MGSGLEPWAVCSCLANRAGVVFSQNLRCSSYCSYYAVQGNQGLASRIDLLYIIRALESVCSSLELWVVCSCLENEKGVVFLQNLCCSSYYSYYAVQGNRGLASRIDLLCIICALESVCSSLEPWVVCSCFENKKGVEFSQNLCYSSYCNYYALQGY